jgi:hypothetical protein
MGYRFRVWYKDEAGAPRIVDGGGSVQINYFSAVTTITIDGEYVPNARLLISTGIFDDEGVEIFEGDVLEIECRDTMWNKPNRIRTYRVDDLRGFLRIANTWVSCRIIGNIATKP